MESLLPYYHISSNLRHATFCYKAHVSHYSTAQRKSHRIASHHIEPPKGATLRLIITTAAERYIPGLPGARRPPLWTPSTSFIPHIHARLFLSHHLIPNYQVGVPFGLRASASLHHSRAIIRILLETRPSLIRVTHRRWHPQSQPSARLHLHLFPAFTLLVRL